MPYTYYDIGLNLFTKSFPAWEAGVLPMNYTRILTCIDDTILSALFPVFEKSYLDLKSLVTSNKKAPLSRCF